LLGKGLSDFILSLKPSKCIILCHHNADPDAIGSAYALSYLFNVLFPSMDVHIVAPEGISLLSSKLLSRLPSIDIYSDFDWADLAVMVDTCSFVQLGSISDKMADLDIPLIVIDHHLPSEEVKCKASLLIVNDNASSTAEIVFSIFEELKVDVNRDVAFALLVGLLYDSRRFIFASSNSFRMAAYLLDCGVDYGDVLNVLSTQMDVSERIARLKAAQRLKILRIKDWIIALSHVSSFEASAARALIDLGADLALVVGGEKELVRLSARSTKRFYEETGLHLGRDLMEPLGKLIHGGGGGHATAAGANGVGDVDYVLKICVKMLREKLS